MSYGDWDCLRMRNLSLIGAVWHLRVLGLSELVRREKDGRARNRQIELAGFRWRRKWIMLTGAKDQR